MAPRFALASAACESVERLMGPGAIHRVGMVEASAKRGADRKSTRLNSSHDQISYAVFCLKKKKKKKCNEIELTKPEYTGAPHTYTSTPSCTPRCSTVSQPANAL